ncbi:MAG: PH domain-containing protein [Thermoplasmatota archaeon]
MTEAAPEADQEPAAFTGWSGRPSLLAAMDVPLKILLAGAGVAAPFVVSAALADKPVPILAALFGLESLNILYALAAPLIPAVQLLFTRYTVDEEGIRVQVQILSRSEHRVQWDKVTAITHRRTLFDRLFGIERLDIIAYGERGATVHLQGLRQAAWLRDLAAQQMRRTATVSNLLLND